MSFRVELAGEYGDPDTEVTLYDDDDELVKWVSDEWREDPSLVVVIANAINIGHTEGAAAIRRRLADGSHVTRCAFGPDGEHTDVVAHCTACGRPTCDYCGYGHHEAEPDWLCPDCATIVPVPTDLLAAVRQHEALIEQGHVGELVEDLAHGHAKAVCATLVTNAILHTKNSNQEGARLLYALCERIARDMPSEQAPWYPPEQGAA